jgi:hypothetical protein
LSMEMHSPFAKRDAIKSIPTVRVRTATPMCRVMFAVFSAGLQHAGSTDFSKKVLRLLTFQF